jgi:aminoglycoside phosphotransferase (APT) family kinase protein
MVVMRDTFAAMAGPEQRDVNAVRALLSEWAEGPVTDVEQPSTGGYSSDTFFFTAKAARLVARFPPAGDGIFPEYDLAQQGAVMRALEGIVPVPKVVAFVDDPPFLVMERVDGRIATDNPPYLRKGWLHDAPPADQRCVHDAFLDACARIHRAPLPDIGLREGLAADIEWWRDYRQWAAADESLVTRFDALASTAPRAVAPPSLLWGDVRIPNVVFDERLTPIAVLDWEMASIGPAELDFGWYLAIHRKSQEQLRASLPGLRDRDDAIAFYEMCLGRELAAIDWYEAWADLRIDLIMSRVLSLLAA